MNSYNNHKTLCRGLQNCLKQIFQVKDCVVLFRDTHKDQFFNIVYSEEDDRKNTFNSMVNVRLEGIKKLREDIARNKD